MARSWMLEGFSAEEWAARNAQNIASFSFDEYRYSEPELDRWVQDLGRILFTPGGVDAARRRYLTPDELRAVEERENEPW